jgi:hypothetical protein
MKSLFILCIFFLSGLAGLAEVPLPSKVSRAPHYDVLGQDSGKAKAVYDALNAILTSQGSTHLTSETQQKISLLYCNRIWNPSFPNGFRCRLEFSLGPKLPITPISVQDDSSSTLAANLFQAMISAGANFHKDPVHGVYLIIKNMISTESELHFDDYSNFSMAPEPNIIISGTPAQNLLNLFRYYRIFDEDGSLRVNCAKFAEPPKCSYQIRNQAGPKLSGEDSQKFWVAFEEAAIASGQKPSWNGRWEEMTVFNAMQFTFDGSSLSFFLKADKVQLPKNP